MQLLLGIKAEVSKKKVDAIKRFLVKATHRRKIFLDLREQILAGETTTKKKGGKR